MCGIAGVVTRDGGPVNRLALERMLVAMAHRGPDGQGVHIGPGIGLGHLRLSILDPSEAGAQPMARAGNVLIHNGEVYNYRELGDALRKDGGAITTGTDTEVILGAYRAMGLDFVRQFNGMFAFALWDEDRHRLILARDRMGVKPLYLRRTARSLAFASEIPALIAAGVLDPSDGWTPRPHAAAVRDFLVAGQIDHSDQTFVEGIVALPPGHLLVVDADQERLIRYWDPPELSDDGRAQVSGTDKRRDDDLVAEFRDTFDSSVALRLRSDVPIGTCLSGGLDSSSIVVTVADLLASGAGGVAPHEQAPRLGFHARFQAHGLDESAHAELVARRAGISLTYRTPGADPLMASILPVLRAQGEPYGGASVHAQFAVMGAAHAADLKVLLDGQGADELLGGYVHYAGVRTAGLLTTGQVASAARELSAQVRHLTHSTIGSLASMLLGTMSPSAIEVVRSAGRGRFGIQVMPALAREPRLGQVHHEPGTRLVRQLWQALSRDGLPSLLRYEDRNSMAFGIEARVPFLDVRLIELGLRLPDRLRIDQGITKVVLRRAMRGRLPASIANRRDKLGFAAPEGAWLAAGRDDIAGLLRGGQLVGRGWVSAVEIDRVLGRETSARRSHEQLWRLLITEAWLRLTWPADPAGGLDVWANALALESTVGIGSALGVARPDRSAPRFAADRPDASVSA